MGLRWWTLDGRKRGRFLEKQRTQSDDWLGLLKWHIANIFSNSFLNPYDTIWLCAEYIQYILYIHRRTVRISRAPRLCRPRAPHRFGAICTSWSASSTACPVRSTWPSLDVQLFLPASDSPLMAGWKVDPNSSPLKITSGARAASIGYLRATYNSSPARCVWTGVCSMTTSTIILDPGSSRLTSQCMNSNTVCVEPVWILFGNPVQYVLCNIKNVRLSDSNSLLSNASQALCPLSHYRAAYWLHVVLSMYVVLTAHYR